MGGLARALGHDLIASSVADALSEGTRISVIQGPPGTGKSWLAKGIGDIWVKGGGATLVAEGETLQRDSDFYPLKFALANLSGLWGDISAHLTGDRCGERAVGLRVSSPRRFKRS